MEVDLGPCEWMLVDCVSGFCCLTHTNSLGVCTLRRWRTLLLAAECWREWSAMGIDPSPKPTSLV